jgi:hypothetical protein
MLSTKYFIHHKEDLNNEHANNTSGQNTTIDGQTKTKTTNDDPVRKYP